MSQHATSLQFDSAALGYAEHVVLRDVALTVRPGEIVGLVGPNGAGKSTMLRAVTRSARVISGTVCVGETNAATLSARDLARVVGVVPQNLSATFAFTSAEYVLMGRHPWQGRLQSASPTDRRVAERVMDLTDTLHLAGERVDTLSGGDLQRVALAQALAQEPSVLLLDEPTSHLDLNHRLQVLDLVRELADGGVAVLAVFHDLDLAARYSDLLAVVAEGMVGPVGSPPQVLSVDLVARVFAVRAVVGTDPVTGTVTVVPVLRDGARPEASPRRAFLVSGSGTGAALMRRLALSGYAISCGALNRGDTDFAVAEALGAEMVALPPFAAPDEAAVREIGRLAREADVRIVCATPFGAPNVDNLRAAVAEGAPMVLVGHLRSEEDFTGGEATRLWEAAIAGGALSAEGVEDVVPLLGGQP